jgi:hypothetical protein
VPGPYGNGARYRLQSGILDKPESCVSCDDNLTVRCDECCVALICSHSNMEICCPRPDMAGVDGRFQSVNRSPNWSTFSVSTYRRRRDCADACLRRKRNGKAICVPMRGTARLTVTRAPFQPGLPCHACSGLTSVHTCLVRRIFDNSLLNRDLGDQRNARQVDGHGFCLFQVV